MSLIGSVTSSLPTLPLDAPGGLVQTRLPLPDAAPSAAPGSSGFGTMLDGLVSMVSQSDNAAAASTNSVMLGNSTQLHQSVIAMQEASVALSLMVQVRNKLVESYQELMRMQV